MSDYSEMPLHEFLGIIYTLTYSAQELWSEEQQEKMKVKIYDGSIEVIYDDDGKVFSYFLIF
jgi:hypothetical protein